jgi:hypothetical protein
MGIIYFAFVDMWATGDKMNPQRIYSDGRENDMYKGDGETLTGLNLMGQWG